MEILGIVIVAAAAIAGTTWQVARDGLRRVPTRSDTGRCEPEAREWDGVWARRNPR
jgi:hypothetical protein